MIPDVAGYTLGNAKAILKDAGVKIHSVVITSPPREKIFECQDYFRVVKINTLDNKNVELIVVKPLL